MSEDIVKLKGSTFGIQLVFDRKVDFSVVKDDIRKKLESGSKFFKRGTVISIEPGILTQSEEDELRKLFHQHAVLFRVEKIESPRIPKRAIMNKSSQPNSDDAYKRARTDNAGQLIKKPSEEQKMMVINRTVRGGQEINSTGSILVIGNVNPGAQIIAGGSIDVRGVCRGLVHAGAYGDSTAFIIADKLMPTQIRIADRIAQPPEDAESPTGAEKASIQNGRIIIETVER